VIKKTLCIVAHEPRPESPFRRRGSVRFGKANAEWGRQMNQAISFHGIIPAISCRSTQTFPSMSLNTAASFLARECPGGHGYHM